MYCMNYVIEKGDTLYSISRHFNIELNSIMEANPLVNVYNLMIGDTICIPVSKPNSGFTEFTDYLIQEGDTLGSVIKNHGINIADLMQYNGLNQIYLLPGTTLQLPVNNESNT